MTDFDYGLANHAIRITSDRSDCVFLWFWPQMTAIRDRIIAAAKQDMLGGEARTARAGLLWGATGQTVRSNNRPVAHLEGIGPRAVRVQGNRRRGHGMGEGERHRPCR